MHSTCTAFIGLGISYVKKRRKLFYCGTFALLITAVIFHALFNTLVQSRFRYFAFALAVLMALPQLMPHIPRKAGSS